MAIDWDVTIEMDDGIVLRAEHDEPEDRPPAIFGGRTTLHAGEGMQSYLLLPFIPSPQVLLRGEMNDE